jgi:hypothetical protein
MKHIIGTNAVLLVLLSLLAACNPDSSEKAGVFVIESDKTYEYPEGVNAQPKEFKGNVTSIEGQLAGQHNLGVVGTIKDGKLRLVLPIYIEDEYLESVSGGGDLKYGKLRLVSGAILFLARDPDLIAELFYYNQDAPGIKEGWNFRYREPDGPYKYTSNIETLYDRNEGYQWLVKVIPAGEI